MNSTNSMTLRALLDNAVARKPRASAMRYYRDGKWHTLTYAELRKQVVLAVEAFADFELEPGCNQVAMIMENAPEWVAIYLANATVGTPVVPLDPKLQSREVAHILHDSEAVVIFADVRHRSMLEEVLPHLPLVRIVVFVDAEAPCETIDGRTSLTYTTLLSAAMRRPLVRYASLKPAPHDVASIIYTSGTTGQPKGAMLTHLNFCSDVQGALEAVGVTITHRDVFFVVLPLFHSFSLTANLVLPLACCGCMAFAQSLRTLAHDLLTLRPTIFFAVPLLVEKIHAKMSDKIKNSNLARLLLACGLGYFVGAKARKGFGGRLRFLVVGGAPTPVQMLKSLRCLGIPIVEGYGLTECAPVVSIPPLRKPRIGSIGPCLPNIKVRIANPNAQGVGELQVRGPIVMKGYFKSCAATREAFDDEWLRTGDLASIDAHGYITIRGRSKALIINREGKNIYPEEVESVMAGDPCILDVVVLGYTQGGVPGERVGALVAANLEYITATYGGTEPVWEEVERMVREQIHHHCKALADYKHPRKIIVQREPLERTSTQKVRRHLYQGELDEA